MNTIKEVATAYLGEKEIPGNMGFTNTAFEKKMDDVGFQKTFAWCSLFMELCVKEGNPAFYATHQKSFSASATTSYKNFDIISLTTQTPQVGFGVIWRHGNGWQGHAGIVVAVDEKNGTFDSVEGNTNDDGSREGYEVAQKKHKLKTPYSAKGLNLVGFIDFSQ